MICIAESGSTKTVWIVIDSKSKTEVLRSDSIGLNPYYTTENEISSVVKSSIPETHWTQIKEVHFYGAGCSNSEKRKLVKQGIQKILCGAEINIEHDLLASARATCQREAGIACILGTGSNSCAFNGIQITDNVPSLGFVLGDEGSGASLGKSLISSWFYREMPLEIEQKFIQRFEVTQKDIIDSVYSKPQPNRYVASFAIFCAENREHPFIQSLIKTNFDNFVTRMVLKYDQATSLPIHFVGSVAKGFDSELKSVLEKHKLQIGRVIKSPIDELVKFHLNGV